MSGYYPMGAMSLGGPRRETVTLRCPNEECPGRCGETVAVRWQAECEVELGQTIPLNEDDWVCPYCGAAGE